MTRDGHIRPLPAHVANKIAAGEVIERPASVLKELVENAIDAGAGRISIETAAGGVKLVSVQDDGCGMTRADALLSLERQATSKIRDTEDIERIDTLGFRGEAVPSIASVSRFTLVTRRADSDEGTRLIVNAGILAETAACGAPVGTRVDVRDLFCNVPARLKFLKSRLTEDRHLKEVFTTAALAHPEIGFTFRADGGEPFRLPPGAALEERIRALFGDALADTLAPAAAETGSITVSGYVQRPGSPDATLRRTQYTFVNGRPATAVSIAAALRRAYENGRLPSDARPAVFLFITLPPRDVDVNVHPAKREVRFRRSGDVEEAIVRAVESALSPVAAPAEAPVRPTTAVPAFDAPLSGPAAVRPVPAPVSADAPVPPQPMPAPAAFQPDFEAADALDAAVPPPQTDAWGAFDVLAVTSTGYAVLETQAGLVTLNPKAARERIVYEKALARETLSQTLLVPETVTLAPHESAAITEFAETLTACGFTLESFGPSIWKVDAVPDLPGFTSAADVLAAVAHDVAEGGARRSANWRSELVAKAVAKRLAGTNGPLTKEAAHALAAELARCRMPYTDPHGRPTVIFRSNAELTRLFKR